jgi:cytochrome P450
MYLVTEPTAARHALLDNHKNYKKGIAAQRLRGALGNGLLLLEGEAWRGHRKLMQPAFHRQKIATLASAFVNETDTMLARWRAKPAGTIIDARDEMLQLTMTLTLRNMFNSDPGELRSLVTAWQHIYDELSRSRRTLVQLPRWIPNRRRARNDAAMETVRQTLDELIRSSKADDQTVLSMLIQARDEENGARLSHEELRDEVMTLFVGGYETSSNALAFALALLAKHTENAKAQQIEIDQVLNGRPPTASDLAALPYTKAVLEETLRLYPPSWMITREALADDTIHNFHVSPGSQLLISAYGLHHAPELWPAPEEFKPERFVTETKHGRFTYIPFGGGPRICLGDQYAMTEMQLVLIRIAQQTSLKLAHGSTIEAQAHVGLRPRHPLRIIPTWRPS